MMKPTIAVAGMCSVLMCAQSIAAPAASANANKPQIPVSETVNSHRTEVNTRYAEQDKELLRADQLARGGQDEDFEAALKIYQDVHLGLELEIGSLDSWIARKRFNEVGTRLDALRLTYGNKKLQEARQAFNEGRYGDAADIAAKVSAVCPALNDKAANLRIVARSRQKGEERLLEVSAYTVLPKLKDDEINIEREIAEARVLMKNRKFEEARRRIENVYKINPFNQEAAYLATQIYAQYYTAGYHRSQADARSMMASEAWQWVEPTFYRSSGNDNMESGQIRGSGDEKIQAQLDAIVIPSVKYDATNISSVVTHLMNTSKRFDDNGKGSGVIIDYIAPIRRENTAAAAAQNTAAQQEGENLDEEEGANKPNPAAAAAAAMPKDKEIFVTLNVNNASLREILDYISFLTDLPYRVYPERVVIGALSDDVKREVFQVTPEAIAMITGDKGNAPEAEAGGDAGGEAGGDGAGGDGALVKGDVTAINISSEDLKRFFGDFGIDFSDPRCHISYSNGKITCFNTQENLNQMDRFIRKLNTVSEMVQIELKTIEISESDMEDLGFNWSLGTSNGDGSTILGNEKWSLAQGANAMLGNALNQLSSSLVEKTGTLVNGLNIFPNLFGSHSPFGSDIQFNLSLSITALDQNERSEMISAPSVLVANKAQAVVKLTTNYYFASDWEEPEIDITSGTDSGPRVEWTPPNPDFDDETEIGTVFTVTPTIKKNGIIGLTINPKISSYIGKDAHIVDGTIWVWRDDKWIVDAEQSRSFEVWAPVISHRELKLEVNVKDGETLVLGGLSDSNMQTRLDKIPILGDIPLIGRLFQSQSEMSTRKNTLIFVTARLVNDQGLPKDTVHNGGIPDINR